MSRIDSGDVEEAEEAAAEAVDLPDDRCRCR